MKLKRTVRTESGTRTTTEFEEGTYSLLLVGDIFTYVCTTVVDNKIVDVFEVNNERKAKGRHTPEQISRGPDS